MSTLNKETHILRTLLQTPREFVTGSKLADELKVTRVAVWTYMEKLREEGFHFDAIRNRGYRLRRLPLQLSEAYLQARLPQLAQRGGLHVLDEVDSTNNEAERLLAAGNPTPLVVLAKKQTQGRGRLGRLWESESSGNFYGSFAFRPGLAPIRMQPFTLWMGLTACRFLEEIGNLKPQLKWPNDIMFNGRKAGGILTEARVDSDVMRDLVLGLGLNVGSIPQLKDSGPYHYAPTSLTSVAKREISLNSFTVALIETLLEAYRVFHEDRYHDAFRRLWARYDMLGGKDIEARSGTGKWFGRVKGLRPDGALIIEEKGGGEKALVSGEVSLAAQP